MGVFTNYSGSSDFYIADSVFLGRNDPKHLTGWTGPFWQQFAHVDGQQFPPVMASYTAIRLMLGHNVAPAIFSVNTNTNYSSSDYNGFRPNPGADVAFDWSSPPWAVARVGADAAPGTSLLETRRFATFDQYQAGSRQDQHSVLVDYDIFVRVPQLDAKDLLRVQQLCSAEDLDFRLRPGSAAVDRGVALDNITDGFAGRAPDLGALEAGQAPPVYGPRR